MKCHHWQHVSDDGTQQVFRCISCRGALTTRKATPDDRTGIRSWSLAGVTLRLERKEGPPACTGLGDVKITRHGRRLHKERA